MKYLLAIAAFIALTGCSAQKEYVAADAATFRDIAPVASWGIDNNPHLSTDDRMDLRNRLIAWAKRIRLAGGGDVTVQR